MSPKPAAWLSPDPFLEDRHLALAERVRSFGEQKLRATAHDEGQPELRTRAVVAQLAETGLLGFAVPPPYGSMDLRSLVTVREALAFYSSLADSAFATQGLGSFAVARAGTEAQKNRWLPAVAAGEVLAAFAVTEPDAGSDLGAVRTRATAEGAVWTLQGVKTFISNAGIAGLYTVLARTGETEHRGLSMFLVDADAPGIAVKRLEPMAPLPLGEVRFEETPALLLGREGEGYRVARAALDAFRPGVGAAACGLAARALEESVRWAQARRQFSRPLSDLQSVQMALADMLVELEAARLLVRRAAWVADERAERSGADAAAAKLFATEAAQRIVDRAVQIQGGQGVMRGATVERLYREVRALRIDQGTTEIQKLVVARHILKESR